MKRLLFFIIIILVGLFLYGKYIEPNNLKINNYIIKTDKLSDSFYDLKIVHFSDILYDKDGKKLDIIKNKINDLKPDIIFFTGDLFNKNIKYNKDDYNKLESFLKELDAYLYKYSVIGDNDNKKIDKYKEIMSNSNFYLLDNDSKLLFYKDNTPIKIIGVSNIDNYNELLESDVPYSYTILLIHKPDMVKNITNADLILSGHSLGGIINIPYYGGLIKKDGAKTYINSHYNINDNELYISNGIGYSKYKFRLFNTPSINVYRFSK